MNKKTTHSITENQLIDHKQNLINLEDELEFHKVLTHQLEQIFDHTIPLCMTDKNFNIVRVNKAYREMTGKTPKECMGKCYDNRPCSKCHTEECPITMISNNHNNMIKCECIKQNKHNDAYYIVTANPYYDKEGNLAGIIESFQDITERTQLEQKIHEHEKFLNTVIDTIQDEISVLSPDLTILQTNQRVRNQYLEIELEGKKCYEVRFNRKTQCEKCPAAISLKSGKLEKGELKITRKDGSNATVEHFAFPMKNDDGEIIAIVEYVRDITEKKRFEEEQKKLISDLNTALSEIKTLQGILPLCTYCKKIRNDEGYWEKVDIYIHKHTNAGISHGICPDCLKEHFPEHYEEIKNDKTSKVKLP